MRNIYSILAGMSLNIAMAAGVHADQLDDKIQAEMKRQKIPGVSLVVVKDGKIVREKGYGLANVEHQVGVKPETIFQSGSVGKQFTAALILLLEQDGKLSLKDPVSKYLSNTPEAWKNITIEHLLTHTSGLGDPYQTIDFRKDYSDQELIDLEATIPMLFQPGERWSYSNMGYHLLGFICNKAGGKFYGDQLRERIFQPLGMSTRIINERDMIMHRAAGYDLVKGEWKNQEWVSPKLNTTADGSLYLTARDLAKWDIALMGNSPLNEAQKRASWTPVKLNDGKTHPYGYGWEIVQVNGHKKIAHGGAWQGFTTSIDRYVDDKLSVIVLTNRSGSSPQKIANIVAADYVPVLKVERPRAITDPEPVLTKHLQTIVQHISDGSIQAAVFDEKMAAFLFPDLIKEAGVKLKASGSLDRLELLSREVDGEMKRLRYRLVFKKESYIMNFRINAEGKIAGAGYHLE
ncbi:serine hydrolase domain-containing protein [Undibacterium seohonense]|nr:serine hydrolase domain-containing protein [Undibacterium seohonense]